MREPIVRVSEGLLGGAIRETLNGKPFFSFEGIPFAEPPLGSLRFKAPLPPKSWEGIRDATSKGPVCLQRAMPQPKAYKTMNTEVEIIGSEDCLYLNVFTPSLPNDKNNLKPVFVFFHGGAFLGGSTHNFGPEVLVAQDVLLVTVAYRVGALGFLAIDDPDLGATGNAALKDLVLALRWIQQNIHAFNGDPNNVTISGESAGAALTHWLILSPAGKGLFHKAIIKSGCALTTWSRGNTKNGLELARLLGCAATENEDILKFLQEIPAEKLLLGQCSMRNGLNFVVSVYKDFAPVVENSSAPDAFMTEHPIELIVSGRYNKVPIIFGFNNAEGGLFFMNLFGKSSSQTAISSVVPHWLKLNPDSEEYLETARKIRKFYLKEDADREEDAPDMESAIKLAGDNSFVRPVMQSAKLHSQTSSEPIYLYQISVRSKLALITRGKTKGVYHSDGLGYLFHFPGAPEVDPESIEDIARKRIVGLFTNFIKTGNPNNPTSFPVKWEAVRDDELKLLDINFKLSMKTNPEAEMMQFWDEIFQTYEHSKHF